MIDALLVLVGIPLLCVVVLGFFALVGLIHDGPTPFRTRRQPRSPDNPKQ